MKYILSLFILICYVCYASAQSDTIKSVELNEVSVQGKSKANILSQKAIKATVLDVKAVNTQSAGLIELMNRTAGIRIRETGGLGANVSLMLNGFEGKAIKYFKNGIPMDYLGSAFNFSIVPVNVIDRIEVYKGVLPVHLGADALGGAVDIVMREDVDRKTIDASYQYGSFNTHRIALHGVWNDSRGWFAGADIFYNYSDNDYKANVPVADKETAVSHYQKLRLFHNGFSNVYTELYGGLRNKPWADELRFGITYFDVRKDNNFGITMTTPFGGVERSSHSFIPTLNYKKKLIDNKLDINQFLVYNKLYTNYTDTVRGVYDWYGNFTSVSSRRGEASSDGNLTKLSFRNFISRTNIGYSFNQNQKLEVNIVYSDIERKGSDPYSDKILENGEDILSVPAKYNKLVIGMGLKSYFMGGKLSNDFLAKLYYINTKGYDGSYISEKDEISKNSTTRWGVGNALKYTFNSNSFIRLSGETAVRLPEQSEFFGDGGFIESNFVLKPERSYNVNLGGYYSTSQFTAELNLFYRRTYDLILLVNTGMFGKYQNVNKVKGLGTEVDLSYSPLPWLRFTGNFTYQDFRLFGQNDPAYQDARLRNTPYFFSNLGVVTKFNNLLKRGDNISFYWHYGFVRQYYLNYVPKNYEPDGFLGLWGKPKVNVSDITIPDQNLHTIGCSWTINTGNNKFAIGAEVKNIFDSDIYDNYRIQNPGRNFNIKLSYTIN